MTGTAIAQAIPLSISPILTRIYTPQDFGILALYMSVAGIFSTIATARYESAIILPKKDSDAMHIVILSILISFLLSVFVFIVILFFNKEIAEILKNKEISNLLYFIPLTILFSGFYQSFTYWSNRKKQYKRLSMSKIVQSFTVGSVKTGMGISDFTFAGLIVGNVIGQGVATIFLGKFIFDEEKKIFTKLNSLKIIAMFYKYISFLKFSTPGAFFQTISTNSMAIFINILFSTSIVGFYSFANSMLRAPLRLIFLSLSQVYRQEAAKLYYKGSYELLVYTNRLQKKMLYTLVPFMIFVFLFSPMLFKIIFGLEWEIAGEYVRYFLPLVFFSSLFTPISSLVDILGKQKFELYWKISFFIFQISSLYISSLYFNFEISILIMSIFGSLHYIYINYYLQKVLKEENR